MCYIDTLATLQASVLQGIKIDSPDKTDNTTAMQAIVNDITSFVNDTSNHTTKALDDFKKLEAFFAEQRRLLTSNVSSAKKDAEAEMRRTEVERKAEQKRIEKAEAASDRKAQNEAKKARKAALLKLSKMLKKPKSPIANKTNGEVQKWALIGAKNNFAPIKKANNKALREQKKKDKEEAAVARKLACAGKPKNAAYSAFCSWFACDGDEIEDAGFANKRDYNKHVWAEGLTGMLEDTKYDTWEDFKKSHDAPWNLSN
jgi:hypothetical protein